MSLIPSAVQGSAGDNYFPLADNAVLRNPAVLPAENGYAAQSASLTLKNARGVGDASDMAVIHYVPSTSGGGLTPKHYQIYMYGPSIGGNGIGELIDGYGLANNYCAMSVNRGQPIDPTRMGTITGTGAPQTVNVPSITEDSDVYFAFVAGTPALAAPIPTIVADTSFSVSLPAGAVYNYEVIG